MSTPAEIFEQRLKGLFFIDNPLEFFKGNNVVITGVFNDFTRSELRKVLQSMGCTIQCFVTENTDLLIAGENYNVDKYEKAIKVDAVVLAFL